MAFWDTRNTTGVPNFNRVDANWESWRVELKAYADLANMGAHLDVAEEQTSFIKHDGLDGNNVTMTRTDPALLITKCEGKALSLVSLVPRRFGLEAWRVLKEEREEKGGHCTAAAPEKYTQPNLPDSKR